MNNKVLTIILKKKISQDKTFKIEVSGTSMMPVLLNGDKLSVKSLDNYHVGDVLVFFYGNNELLVHRLLKIYNNRYYCKGDNAFRLEDISFDRIIGKVISVTRNNDTFKLPKAKDELINMSYMINKEFKRCKDVKKTKQSQLYREYKKKYL